MAFCLLTSAFLRPSPLPGLQPFRAFELPPVATSVPSDAVRIVSRMPNLPAFCRNCGAVFGSGIVVENSTNLTFSGCTAGPCPRCGGIGDIPDGTFDVIGDTIRVLSAPDYTHEKLRRLADIIRGAQSAQASPEQIVETLEREAPELQPFLQRLVASPEAVAAWLALLLMVLQVLMSLQNPPATADDVEKITNRAVERCIQQP